MYSCHKLKQMGGIQSPSFAPQKFAFLKYFQVPSKTGQLDMLVEGLYNAEKDNHATYSKVSFFI